MLAAVCISAEKVVVHFFCAWNLNTFRKLHMDEMLRALARDMHGGHCAFALTLVWLHWIVLDIMVTFCATMPWLGLIAHVPAIALMAYVLWIGTQHLKRRRNMIKARLV